MSTNLLLVDDDKSFIEAIRPILIQQGYNTDAAYDGTEAKKILSEHPKKYEVVILDWNMPQLNGIDVLKWIKHQSVLEPLQVILQTSNDSTENIKQGIEAGAFYYLIKPCKKEVLLSTIRSAVLDHERKKDLLQKLRDSENSFRLLEEGTFRFKTIAEGDFLAIRIANIASQPEEAMYVSELFANAVEHGNLGITYDEKTQLIDKGLLKQEVDSRLTRSENSGKYVQVQIRKKEGTLHVRIQDEGNGFDFSKYLHFDDSRIFDNHGRGIAICNSLLKIHYEGSGNIVHVELPYIN
jgi:DNA-binding response OmpR family regulator